MSSKPAPPTSGDFKESGMPSGLEIAVLVLIAVLLVFGAYWLVVFNPNIDIEVSRYFQFGEQSFVLRDDRVISLMRRMMMNGFAVYYVCVVVCGVLAWRRSMPVLRMQWHKWMFTGVCGLVGPTLLVNVILKAHWGRARPVQTLDLGGNLEFSQFWIWSDQCPANCSFVSGEVATAVMIPISLALLSVKWRPAFYAVAIMICAFDGYLRIAQGAHYLTDAFMTLPLMMMTACLVYFVFYLWRNSPLVTISHRVEGS